MFIICSYFKPVKCLSRDLASALTTSSPRERMTQRRTISSDSPAHQLNGYRPKGGPGRNAMQAQPEQRLQETKLMKDNNKEHDRTARPTRWKTRPGSRLSTPNSVHVRCRYRNFDDPVERSPSAGESARHSSEARTPAAAPDRQFNHALLRGIHDGTGTNRRISGLPFVTASERKSAKTSQCPRSHMHSEQNRKGCMSGSSKDRGAPCSVRYLS